MSRNRDLKILLIMLIALFSAMYYVKKVDFQPYNFISIAALVFIIFIPLAGICWIFKNQDRRWCIAINIVYCLSIGAILIHNHLRAQGKGFVNFKYIDLNAHGAMVPCKSNLKNIATAMEMYSSDNEGCYPHSLEAITPNYLKTLPTCASAGKITYKYVYTSKPDIYTVWCHGAYHTPMSRINMPEYDSLKGLYEK
ncbi:MAG: hypothetical protein AB9903_06045 [Vulcanimicrobiota bacterium]